MKTTLSVRPLGAASAAVLALAATAPSSAQIASALLQEDGPLPGTPGETIDSINNTAVNHVGGYAATVDTSGSGTTLSHVWGNAAGGPGSVLRTEGTFGNLMQTSYESFYGISDSGAVCYSASSEDLDSGTTGLDGVWLDDTVVLNEEDPVAAFPGMFSSFNSRPGVTADGIPYWVGGLTDVQGGSSQFREIFFSTAITPVIAAGDFVGGVPEPVEGGSGIDFDFRFSALGTNWINQVVVDATSADDGVVVINGDAAMAGGSIIREAFPVPASVGGLPGENWDNFDYFGITEAGDTLVTGDTDADTSMDEFILRNGEIVLREGDMVESMSGPLPLSGAIEGAYLNVDGDYAAIWDVDAMAGNLEALLLNGVALLLEGDPVDWNNDGMIDAGDDGAVITNFTGISSLTLGDRDSQNVVNIYFTADVDIAGEDVEGFFCLSAAAAEPPALLLALDIKPGSCPNSFNRGSNGVLPVALLGSEDFDIMMVDVSTALISRADGIGGFAAPNEGPPGPHSVYDDVATPFEGEACDCHELEGDGWLDLSMKFKTQTVVGALEMDDLPPGDLVELVVTGQLLDGTLFEASDCVRLVPPGTPPGMMLVSAPSADGVWIDASPPDLQLDGGGFATFVRTYPLGSYVTLVAEPAFRGRVFAGWLVDGEFVTSRRAITRIVIGETEHVEAVYALAGEMPFAPGRARRVGGSSAP